VVSSLARRIHLYRGAYSFVTNALKESLDFEGQERVKEFARDFEGQSGRFLIFLAKPQKPFNLGGWRCFKTLK